MIIAVAAQKGGVGKSSVSISFAAGLARRGKKVLLVDDDPQANSSKVLLPNYPELSKEETVFTTVLGRNPLPIRQTTIENFDIVPSHILLSNTDISLTTAIDHRESRLKDQLDKVKDKYDYIFIDSPPSLSWLTINALTAADKALIIVSPGYFELDSIIQMSKTVSEVVDMFNPRLKIMGILFNMSDNTINTKTSLQILRQTYPNTVLKTVVPRNTDLRDAHFSHKDIFEFAPNSLAAQAFNKLIEELFTNG